MTFSVRPLWLKLVSGKLRSSHRSGLHRLSLANTSNSRYLHISLKKEMASFHNEEDFLTPSASYPVITLTKVSWREEHFLTGNLTSLLIAD